MKWPKPVSQEQQLGLGDLGGLRAQGIKVIGSGEELFSRVERQQMQQDLFGLVHVKVDKVDIASQNTGKFPYEENKKNNMTTTPLCLLRLLSI